MVTNIEILAIVRDNATATIVQKHVTENAGLVAVGVGLDFNIHIVEYDTFDGPATVAGRHLDDRRLVGVG